MMTIKQEHDWRWWAALAFAAAIGFGVVFMLTGAASASETIDIEIGVIRGDPGELVLVDNLPAGIGDSCTGQVHSRNNSSMRDDTDFVFISDGTVVLTIAGVEAEGFDGAGIGFTANGPVDVYVRLGARGVFSAGVFLEVTCNPPTTTTTEPPPPAASTTTSIVLPAPTVPPVTPTTLSPPPVGGIPAGGGACSDGACDPIPLWMVVAVFLLATGATAASAISATKRGTNDNT